MLCYGVAFKLLRKTRFIVLAFLLLAIEVFPYGSLGLEDKAGQLLLLTIRTDAKGNNLLELDDATRNLIKEIQPGGIILYAHNMRDLGQIRSLVKEIRALCRIPPFLAIDEEGGRVSRIKSTKGLGAPVVPPARQVAANGEDFARRAYGAMARNLWLMGINMDFAPVLDLDFHPDLEYLGDRSYGADPGRVGRFGTIMMEELHRRNIVAVAKHFPGHGRSSGDSHVGSQRIAATMDELSLDLDPFRALMNGGLGALMSSHLVYDAVEKSGLPASLSKAVLTGLAREELGFEGLIMTDALEMKGLKSSVSEGRAAIMAMEAGADMLMAPTNPRLVKAGLVQAIREGRLGQGRLDDAVSRILRTKQLFRTASDEGLLVELEKALLMLQSSY